MNKSLVRILGVALMLLAVFQLNAQDVPYVPTPYEVVEGMLKLAEVTDNDIVYDLGCGDGRIVVTAAKKYGAKGVGVDSNSDRIKESKLNAESNNLTDKVEFYQKNLFETDLSEASVVTLYLLSSVNIKLRPKLFQELKPGTRVVSNSFDMDEWKPDKQEQVDYRNIYFWKIPANASGKWELTSDKNSGKYILNIEQQFQQVSGTVETGKEKSEITDAKIDGENLVFSVNKKNGDENEKIKFEGKVSENKFEGKTISSSGTSNFIALRDEKTKRPLEPSLLNAGR